eukprot:scaffold58798_cov31-Attheya_sp.AAC.1
MEKLKREKIRCLKLEERVFSIKKTKDVEIAFFAKEKGELIAETATLSGDRIQMLEVPRRSTCSRKKQGSGQPTLIN